MTTDESGQTFAYDAWGRVATVNGTGIVYKNDALGRRIAETKGGVTTDLYYSPGWQLIEERVGSNVRAQNVWSSVYIDALVLRDTIDTAAGSLDSTFDSDGKLTLQLGATDRVRAIVQGDGKVLVAGYSGNNTGLARFNADGSLDADFDGPAGTGNGKFLIDLGGTEKIRAVALQSDGKILIAGVTNVNGTDDVFVGRLNIDGSWDNTFDTDGRRIDSYGGADQAYGVAVDSQSRVVVAGVGNGDVLIARYTSAGAKDTAGFNAADTPGYLRVSFSGTDRGDALAIDGQDRIVVAGMNGAAARDVILARVTSAGLLDTAFNTTGKITTDFGATDDSANAVAIDGQGRIVIAGGSGGDMMAARYTDSGALDNTFDTDGKAYVDFGTVDDSAEDMRIDGFGRIVLAGRNNSIDFAVARLTSAGALDTTFDGDGKATIDFQSGGIDEADAVAIQPDGKIIVAGSSEKGTAGADFAVARISGGGTRLYAMQDANFNTTAVADAAGKVVERYIYDAYGSFTVINPDGTADPDAVRDVDMPVLWQGMRYEPASKLWDARTRFVSSVTGRPLQQDFAGYIDGLNLYQWERSNPIIYSDPLGTVTPGKHHPYPCHLGGAYEQPRVYRTGPQHRAAHRYLRQRGFGPGTAGRAAWRALTSVQRQAHIMRSMRAAGVSNRAIRQNINAIMRGANPGVSTPRTGSLGPIFRGLASGAVLNVLLNPSTAYAATIDDMTINLASRVLLDDGATDVDGDGIPAEIDPDDSKPSRCSPCRLIEIEEELRRAIQGSVRDIRVWVEDRSFLRLIGVRDRSHFETHRELNMVNVGNAILQAREHIQECEKEDPC